MQKLDRLGWAAGLAFTSFGVRVGVRTTDLSVMRDIELALPPGWKPTEGASVSQLFSVVAGGAGHGKGVRRMWLLYDGWVRKARGREPEPVLDALGAAIRLKVAEHAPRRVFVHAGAVGWQGRAIVIPGRSYSGKSTLVAELVRLGATYYSDEYAVIDERGRVHPFATPISTREPGGFEGRAVDPHTIGRVGSKALPLGLVVATTFKEGVRFRPRELSRAEGVLAMLENTVSARTAPARAMETLRAAMAPAVVVKGSRGEAGLVAERILELAGS